MRFGVGFVKRVSFTIYRDSNAERPRTSSRDAKTRPRPMGLVSICMSPVVVFVLNFLCGGGGLCKNKMSIMIPVH